MRIVIAGASGFIGQMLVPELAARGAELILLGRDQTRLARHFAGHICASYDALPDCAKGADVFLNLAVINTNARADLAAMQAVNADFAAQLATQARAAGVTRFVQANSIHALDPFDQRPYAVSKRAGITAIDAIWPDGAVHIFLPAMVGPRFAGALAPLNHLSPQGAESALGPLGALKPLLRVDDLAQWITTQSLTAPRQVILTPNQDENPAYRVVKRGIDMIASVAGMVALAPVFLATWAAIRAQGDGPAIFAQTRIGREGKAFTCYKFRTMALGTKQAGTHEVSQSAVTPLGAKLRRWKIDELPQLWNVFWGDMALIGPRPCLPSQTELVAGRRAAGVLTIRPGISGLAQVAGIDMSDPARLVEWDARYLALRGHILDLKLILQTAKGGGRGDRVAK